MIIRKIKCSTKKCSAELEEKTSGAGWPGWCHLQGDFKNDETGEEGIAHLCPNCKIKHLELLNGE